MSARKPRQKSAGVIAAIIRFDSDWRRRQDAFWDGILNSRIGPAVSVIFVAIFAALGLLLLFTTLESLSTGVLHGRGGRTYLSDAPAYFWARFMWNLVLGGLMVGGIVLGLWARFGTARGKRNAAQRRRRAKRKSSDSE